jgi:hypothetical protein
MGYGRPEMSCATHRLYGGNGIPITLTDAKRDVVMKR